MHLVKVDHHNGVMSLETTFPIPEGYRFLEAHGQGRAIGFLIQKTRETTRATIIHLDYPGVSLEFKVSPAYADEAKLVVSNLSSFASLVSLNITWFFSGTSASQPETK